MLVSRGVILSNKQSIFVSTSLFASCQDFMPLFQSSIHPTGQGGSSFSYDGLSFQVVHKPKRPTRIVAFHTRCPAFFDPKKAGCISRFQNSFQVFMDNSVRTSSWYCKFASSNSRLFDLNKRYLKLTLLHRLTSMLSMQSTPTWLFPSPWSVCHDPALSLRRSRGLGGCVREVSSTFTSGLLVFHCIGTKTVESFPTDSSFCAVI